MKPTKSLLALALLASATTTGTAQASLFDRGNGLLYDDVLNVTWLQDANFAKTSGYSATGQMDWFSANTWATNLNYQGITGWRLASNTPINGSSFNYSMSFDSTTDRGYNITSPRSELAYMSNVNLGLKNYVDVAGNYQANWGVFGNGTLGVFGKGTADGQADIGLVKNLQNYGYWSGTEISPGSGNAWYFSTYDGYQLYYGKDLQFYAWAVRPGDVSAVPVPAAFWLFGSGLIGLIGFKRRGNIG